MKALIAPMIVLLLCFCAFGQAPVDQLFAAERAFAEAAAVNEVRAAFLSVLADDAVIFRPEAVNGREYWSSREAASPARLIRRPSFADISSNGMLGYTTGAVEFHPKGGPDAQSKYGQYVTIWEKKIDGKFRVSLDIGISHEHLPISEARPVFPRRPGKDPNKRGWSAADPSMNFLKMSMTSQGVSGAYKKFAAPDVVLLFEGFPPITGKKRVVSATKQYQSISFPTKTAQFQAADMAYTWNPCEFTVSNEGKEKGNCLHIWKLRSKKWYIVMGVFSPFPNVNRPELKTASGKSS